MKRVIGFEGSWPDSSVIAWGAAAIDDDINLTNAVSGHAMPSLSRSDLEDAGALTLLPDDIELRPEHGSRPLIVLAIRRDDDLFNIFAPDTGRLGGLVGTKRNKAAYYYVFRDRTAFNQYASEIADQVTRKVLRGSVVDDKARLLIGTGLILKPSSPYLHALRAYFSTVEPARAASVGRAALGDDISRRRFDHLFAALTLTPSSDSQYWLKYVDGVAEGGGFDTDVAAEQFGALARIHRKIQPLLVEQTPFLESEDDIPPPRVHELKAASANIGFGIALPNRPLLERVVRYFELQMIQDIVRGHVPQDLQGDSEFQDALTRLLKPSPETQVLQRPLGEEQTEPAAIQPSFEAAAARSDARLRIFGTVEGIKGEVRRAELKFFPSLRESVSTTDDGYGNSPAGNVIFQNTNDFLFRPAIFGVDRFVDPNRRYRFFLNSCHILDSGDAGEIDAIPSSIVPGAYLRPPKPVTVTVTSGCGMTILGTDLGIRRSPSLQTVNLLLSDFERWAKDFEITSAERGEASWVPPVQPRRPSAIFRLLIALDVAGGAGVVTDIIAEVNRRFETMVRRNNTFREISRNKELVEIDEEDDDIIRLTSRGQLLMAIYKSAGGLLGRI